MSSRTLTILMKMMGLRNWLILNGLSFSGPAKTLLSKPIHCRLFHHRTQRLGALLLQTCQSLLKSLIHQRLLFLLKTVKTELQESMRRRLSSPTKESQGLELQESTRTWLPSLAKESQGPELQDNRERRPSSPPARDQELQGNKEHKPPSPPAQDQELQGNKERMPPSPPA
jgi:hypothetical protein